MTPKSLIGLVTLLLAGWLTVSPCQAIDVEIANVNADNFPSIHVFVRAVDDSGNYLEDLGPSNFEVRENGTLVNTAVQAQFGYMAVSLVMDASGSMLPYTSQVINSCSFFINGLEDLDKGAIVRFSTLVNVIVPMTYDKNALLAGVNSYSASGSTALWDAIDSGITACYYEPEKKAVVAFTDGNENASNQPALVLPTHAGSDITIYTIGIGDQVDPDSLTWVAEQTGGFFIAIDSVSQVQQVLDDIRNDIGNLYDIYYQSPTPTTNGTRRAIQVICNYQNHTAWDTASYIAPTCPPPDISLSPSTLQLLGNSQNPNTTLNVACTITSTAGINNARIYYKTIGMLYYSQANLIHGTENNYSYNIPASVVQNPGLVFYLQTTDTRGATVTSPAFEPGDLPYFIPVLPNYAPQITYSPPDEWLIRRTMDVQATVTDATNNVSQVTLYFRNSHDFFYTALPMQSLGGNLYKTAVPGNYISDLGGLMMFIAAWDDHGLANYWHLSDDPYALNVVNELSPTPPVVILTPANPPIVIPASGGSFTYTRRTINPLPIVGTCDVWCDIVSPGGAVQSAGELTLNLSLPGGAFQEQTYTQQIADTAAAGQYWFRAHTGVYPGSETFFTDSFSFTKSVTSGPIVIDPNQDPNVSPFQPAASDRVRLSAGSPNPFNASTSLEYTLPEAARIKITIHDLSGREIACLDESYRQPGYYSVVWDASSVPSGIYFCRLAAGTARLTTKLCLVK